MTKTSALNNIYKKGLFGDYENKSENELIKVSELKDLLIVQIVQFKNSSLPLENINIEDLNLNDDVFTVSENNESRILWCGPKNWLLVSTKKNLCLSIWQFL